MEGGTALQFLCVLMGNSLNTHRTCHAATTPKEHHKYVCRGGS